MWLNCTCDAMSIQGMKTMQHFSGSLFHHLIIQKSLYSVWFPYFVNKFRFVHVNKPTRCKYVSIFLFISTSNHENVWRKIFISSFCMCTNFQKSLIYMSELFAACLQMTTHSPSWRGCAMYKSVISYKTEQDQTVLGLRKYFHIWKIISDLTLPAAFILILFQWVLNYFSHKKYNLEFSSQG